MSDDAVGVLVSELLRVCVDGKLLFGTGEGRSVCLHIIPPYDVWGECNSKDLEMVY